MPLSLPHAVFLKPSPLENASPGLLNPLWCGSTGQPDFVVALSHDLILSDQLSRLSETLSSKSEESQSNVEPDDDQALLDLIKQIRKAREEDRQNTIAFQNQVNRRRCWAKSFPYNSCLQRAVRTPGEFKSRKDFDLLKTPSDLLALRRTQQQRADDVDHLVKKFAFCVPKAGVGAERCRPFQGRHEAQEVLLRPLEEYLRPFRPVQARLSSFFPDKNLVQL